MTPRQVRLVHRGGGVRECSATGFEKRSVSLNLGRLNGYLSCSLTHGWCEKPCEDWRLDDASLEMLRELWNEENAPKRIIPMPRGTGPKRKPRTGGKVEPRQEKLF